MNSGLPDCQPHRHVVVLTKSNTKEGVRRDFTEKSYRVGSVPTSVRVQSGKQNPFKECKTEEI